MTSAAGARQTRRAQRDGSAAERTPSPAPRATSAGLVDGVWRTLSSVKLAIILILAIAAGAFIGAALMQAPPPALDDPAQFDLWLDQARAKYGLWTDLFARLQLFNVFSSVWFRLLIVLLVANILVCTTSRAPRILSQMRRPVTVRVTDAMFERAPLTERAQAGTVTLEQAAARAEAALRRRRFRVRSERDGDTVHLFAEKNKFARLGTLVHHAGIVAVLLAAVWGGRGGWRESQFIIAEGDVRAVGHDTDISIRLDSFIDEYYAGGGGIPKDYRSEITLLKGGEEVARGTVRVNEPVIHDGLRVHQAFYGPAILMRVDGGDGEPLFEGTVPLNWVTQQRPAGSFTVPEAGVEVFVVAPASAFIDTVIRPGEVRLEVYPIGGNAPLALENLSQTSSKLIGGLRYTFVRESRFTGLQIVKDPALPLLWIGSGAVVLGSMAVLLFPHRRLWARAEIDAGGRTTVRLAAPKERGLPFEFEFKRIADSVRTRLAKERSPALSQGES